MAVICVCSPKGGVGKTTLAANIAHGLQRAGGRVLAVDIDPQNALRLHFGIPLADDGGYAPELGRQDWRIALRRTASGVTVLPHGSMDSGARLAMARGLDDNPELLAAMLREAAADPGVTIVLDTPPGASRALATVLPLADVILAVLLADGGSVAMLPEIETGRFLGRGTMGAMLNARMRFVLNQVHEGSRLSATVATALMRHLGPRLLGMVARDDAVAEALACEQLIADHAPESRAAYDIVEIVRALQPMLPAAANPSPGVFAGAGR